MDNIGVGNNQRLWAKHLLARGDSMDHLEQRGKAEGEDQIQSQCSMISKWRNGTDWPTYDSHRKAKDSVFIPSARTGKYSTSREI